MSMRLDDDNFFSRDSGGQGPDLVVSIRESLLEDSRIVSSLERSTSEPSPALLDIDREEPSEYQLPAQEFKLSSVISRPSGRAGRFDAPQQCAPAANDTVKAVPLEAVRGRRSLLVRLLPSLVPGILSFVATAAIFGLLTFDGHPNGGIISGRSVSDIVLSTKHAIQPVSAEPGQSISPAVLVPPTRSGDAGVSSPSLDGLPPVTVTDLAATKSLLDQVAVRQDQLTRDLAALKSVAATLSQMISTLQSRPPGDDDVQKKLLSQNEQMAHDIAALQTEQQTLGQKIANMTRPRQRAKVARPN
jgi:hypothetical protein